MRKRSTRAKHHRHHVKVLKSEVMSPRIAWFNFLDALNLLIKLAVVIVLLGIAGYGVKKAIKHTFHDNTDFRLQAIKLTANDTLDEAGLVEHLEIDLAANIFNFDVDLMQERLLEIPAIRYAKVERELPGTLIFKIETRKPLAWIASLEQQDSRPVRRIGALLIDHDGTTYPCPENQFEQAKQLPTILLESDSDHPIEAGLELKHPEYRRCFRLLESFTNSFPEDVSMVEAIYQENPWSVNLQTRSGTIATFGLDDHKRQLDYFGKALHHSRQKDYEIETINLIPKQNVPITVSEPEAIAPRAIIIKQ